MTLPPPISPDQALFLDFDGTLVDLAPTPDGVVVPDGLTDALSDLSDFLDGALAIVSGRMLDDVGSYLTPLVLPGSGSHGVERRRGDGSVETPDAHIRDTAKQIAAAVRERVGERPGLIYEQKHWSAALHFRKAPDLEDVATEAMAAEVARHDGWELMVGKMMVEGRFAGRSKASAVRAFMQEAPFAGRRPVFIGDDVTDEDGIRAAVELGGFGIKVGAGESAARYRLDSPDEVLAYLMAART